MEEMITLPKSLATTIYTILNAFYGICVMQSPNEAGKLKELLDALEREIYKETKND